MAASSPRHDHGATPLFRFCLLLRAQALVCLYPVRPSRFFDSRGDNCTTANLRDDLVPVHPGRVPYEWFAYLYSLVSRSFRCPVFCHGVCVGSSRSPLSVVSCSYCPVSPLCSTPPCPWRLDQRPDYSPFLLAKLWSMSYLGPVLVDPIDRQKPSF